MNFLLQKSSNVPVEGIYHNPRTTRRTGYFVAFIQVPGNSMAGNANAGSVVCEGARARKARSLYIVIPASTARFHRKNRGDLSQEIRLK